MNVHFSSATDDWETPIEVFNKLNKEFKFEYDVCASRRNSKCDICYFDKEMDGLKQSWYALGPIWMNPPYGREIVNWVKKAYEESLRGETVVCLLPSRTDTRWWHNYVMKAKEIRFIKGRLKFGNAKNSAPFPSCVVIFK